MKKLKTGVAARARRVLDDWSLPRQPRGEDVERHAAKRHASSRLSPRLDEADTVGTAICRYCAVGCAQLVYAKNGKAIHVEGDPKSPINAGTLCPKGAATFGWLTSESRLSTVKYRAPYSDRWEE